MTSSKHPRRLSFQFFWTSFPCWPVGERRQSGAISISCHHHFSFQLLQQAPTRSALDSAKVNSIALQACRPASPSAQQPSQAITRQLHSLSDNTELSRVNSRLTRPDVPDSAQSKVLSSPELPKVRKIPCSITKPPTH